MLELLRSIAEFASHVPSRRQWRVLVGNLLTAVVCLILFVALPTPGNWLAALAMLMLGFTASRRWDIRARRRGKAPPAGGWRD